MQLAAALKYRPEPTLAEFHEDNSFLRGVMGPVGSGKSVAMVIEVMRRALAMPPSVRDGVRKSRFAVVRNTYGELKSTTIKTWQDWFPHPPVVYDTPIRWRAKADYQPGVLPDGTPYEGPVDIEVLFLALDRPDHVRKLKSLELTWGWGNEAVELPLEVIHVLADRVGRYPMRVDCPRGYASGIFLDTNACDDDHWWYRAAEVETPEGWRFWRQPPALIKEGGVWIPNKGQTGLRPAENINHQPKGWRYYLDAAKGKSDEHIRVYYGAEYGTIQAGRPVYPEFDDRLHVAKEDVAPVFGRLLLLGWDFGLTPACVVAQELPDGKVVVLAEYAVGAHAQMGIRQFARDVVLPGLREQFGAWFVSGAFISYGDPAGRQKAQTDETTCLQILEDEGIPTAPAATNAFQARRDAVGLLLVGSAESGPRMLINPSCRMLRKGFRGKYCYERVQLGGVDARYKEYPSKNIYSHIQDALQYAVLNLTYSNTLVDPLDLEACAV